MYITQALFLHGEFIQSSAGLYKRQEHDNVTLCVAVSEPRHTKTQVLKKYPFEIAQNSENFHRPPLLA